MVTDVEKHKGLVPTLTSDHYPNKFRASLTDTISPISSQDGGNYRGNNGIKRIVDITAGPVQWSKVAQTHLVLLLT